MSPATPSANPLSTATPAPQPLPKPKLPGLAEIFQQVRSDLFGKDVQETQTYSYAWLADQFGHFGLGFEISIVLGWLLALFGFTQPLVRVGAAAAVFLGLLVKETFDYVREQQRSNAAHVLFPFDKTQIVWNIITALFYVFYGVAVASTAVYSGAAALVVLAVLAVPAVWVAFSWLRAKLIFQQAGLPYLYRLANFPNPPVDQATVIPEILKLAAPNAQDGPLHLIISGPLSAGKSSLAVGIATEFAMADGIGRYSTLFKLLETIDVRQQAGAPPDQTEFKDGRILWPWETSDLLVIDDVDDVLDAHTPPARTHAQPQTSVQQVETLLRAGLDGFIDRLNLKARRTVWVLSDDASPADWKAMLVRVLKIDNPDKVVLATLPRPILKG